MVGDLGHEEGAQSRMDEMSDGEGKAWTRDEDMAKAAWRVQSSTAGALPDGVQQVERSEEPQLTCFLLLLRRSSRQAPTKSSSPPPRAPSSPSPSHLQTTAFGTPQLPTPPHLVSSSATNPADSRVSPPSSPPPRLPRPRQPHWRCWSRKRRRRSSLRPRQI